MASEAYQNLRAALQGEPTEEARKKAAEAMEKYVEFEGERRLSLVAKRKNSTPTLVNLGLDKGYPKAIPLTKIPEELEKNPEVFKLLQKVVGSSGK